MRARPSPRRMPEPGLSAAFWTLLALGLALRLVAIGYGLPAVFNGDEPHHVNIAVSFGRGSLDPRFFKYPTLWMYALFAAYIAYFAIWSGLGLRRRVHDFGVHFAWHPGPFYLIGRLLAAGFSVLALERVYRTARSAAGERAAWIAAGALAVSPVLIESAHAAKPESMMLFLAAWAWWHAERYLEEGGARRLAACGAAAGLALSTQFTAAPLGVLLPAVWLARRRIERVSWTSLVVACAAAGAAFLAGSPYLLAHRADFAATLRDFHGMAAAGSGPAGVRVVVLNVLGFAGPAAVLGGAWAIGAAWLVARQPRRAAMLLLPVAAAVGLYASSPEGAWQRYLLGVFPSIAITAGLGLDKVLEWASSGAPRGLGRPALAAAVAVACLAPGAIRSAGYDREISLPDTRTIASRWIESHLPLGSAILLDQEHASPSVPMRREEVASLLERTRQAGHPRARYYQYLLDGHPGGGYEVYRVLRDYRDLHSYPSMVALSAAGQPMLDVRDGVRAALKAGVRYVVLSSNGADPVRAPELARFLAEVPERGRLIAEFAPDDRRVTGPSIRIYDLRPRLNRSDGAGILPTRMDSYAG